MNLNKIFTKNAAAFSNALRFCSNKSLNVTINNNGIALVAMNRKPVNALNYEFLSELAHTFGDLEKQKIRGMILTSATNNVFSAGLDFEELIKPQKDRFHKFFGSLHEMWMKLFASSYPTVAVINGHAPAGGCVIATSCEYRIILDKFLIGLNETQVGLYVPEFVEATFGHATNQRVAELACTEGRMFGADEALKIGLVDEVVNGKDEGIERAEKFLMRFAKIDTAARSVTKRGFRNKIVKTPKFTTLSLLKVLQAKIMLPFKAFSKHAAIATNILRHYSSGGKLVDVAVNDKTGVATVTMNRMPVNSLNLDLLTELSKTFEQLENNKARGMILTSASNSVFSAGLDIMEMYKPNEDRCRAFWSSLQETWMKLFGSVYPTVAVINGHAPAGGCLLSMSCEYRVMMNNFTIGLNETQLGIVAPGWFINTMKNTISARDTEIALTTGKLFTTDEALKVGLVDEIASDKADGIARAEKYFARFAKIHPVARTLTKMSLREKTLQDLQDNREEDIEKFMFFINQPKVQKGLEMYIESLKKKK